MPHEALKTNIPLDTIDEPSAELIALPNIETSQDITDALAGSIPTLFKMTADPRFHATCMEAGIDPYEDMGTPKYWDTFARYGSGIVARAKENGHDSLKLRAFELMSATPSAVVNTLESHAGKTSDSRTREIQRTTSDYNSLLRNFAADYPNTKASEISLHLLNAASMARENPLVSKGSTEAVKSVVRGAQHELGFGQILAHTGRSSRPATGQEDRGGVDYVADGDGRKQIYIDVKASLFSVQQEGGTNAAYVVRSNGTVVMYSLIQDKEFNDTFFISDEAASGKAEALDELLSHAQSRRRAA